MFVVPPPEPPRPEDVEREARRLCTERRAQLIGPRPSRWRFIAFDDWCRRVKRYEDMQPTEYDRITARNRLREGRAR